MKEGCIGTTTRIHSPMIGRAGLEPRLRLVQISTRPEAGFEIV